MLPKSISKSSIKSDASHMYLYPNSFEIINYYKNYGSTIQIICKYSNLLCQKSLLYTRVYLILIKFSTSILMLI